ncbi:hypothetical protein Tco_0580442 [Tanacetum coccineum]
MQQFWKTVKQVPNAKDTIRFMVDKTDIIYTLDMFRSALKLPTKTNQNLFIPSTDFSYIKEFLKIIGYEDKYPPIPKRLNEPCHSIKDDTPLSHMYTTGEVTKRAMQIPDELLNGKNQVDAGLQGLYWLILPAESTQGTIRTPSATKIPNPKIASKKNRKQVIGESSTPKKSIKIRIKQRQPASSAPIPTVNDIE